MKKKLLALFLCCVMVFSLVPVALTSAFATGDGFQIYSSNGTVAETVLLQMSEKMDLTAVAETGSVSAATFGQTLSVQTEIRWS